MYNKSVTQCGQNPPLGVCGNTPTCEATIGWIAPTVPAHRWPAHRHILGILFLHQSAVKSTKKMENVAFASGSDRLTEGPAGDAEGPAATGGGDEAAGGPEGPGATGGKTSGSDPAKPRKGTSAGASKRKTSSGSGAASLAEPEG